MCVAQTQKSEGIAGKSGFSGLRSHDWESGELWDGLLAGSVLLWDSLWARSRLLWGGLQAGSWLWVAYKSEEASREVWAAQARRTAIIWKMKTALLAIAGLTRTLDLWNHQTWEL